MVSSLMLRLIFSFEPGLSVWPGKISRYLMPSPAALSTVSKKDSRLKVQHCSDNFRPSFSEAESSRCLAGASAADREVASRATAAVIDTKYLTDSSLSWRLV